MSMWRGTELDQPPDRFRAFSAPHARVLLGDFPSGYFQSCSAIGGSEIVRIQIVEPDGA